MKQIRKLKKTSTPSRRNDEGYERPWKSQRTHQPQYDRTQTTDAHSAMKPNYSMNKYHPIKKEPGGAVLIRKPSQTGGRQQKTPDETSEKTKSPLPRRQTTDTENTHIANGPENQRAEMCSTTNATSEIHSNRAAKSKQDTDREKSCAADGDDRANCTVEEITNQRRTNRQTGDHTPEYGRCGHRTYSANKLGSIHRIAATHVAMETNGRSSNQQLNKETFRYLPPSPVR